EISGAVDTIHDTFVATEPGRYALEMRGPVGVSDIGDVARWEFAVSGPVCGDGVLDEFEFCDEGTANSDSSPNACRLACGFPRCGDSVVDMSETCDAGVNNDDANPSSPCRENCGLWSCGDGVLDVGEDCDDGAEN